MVKNGGVKVYVVCRMGFELPVRVYLNPKSAASFVRTMDKRTGRGQFFWVEQDLITNKSVMVVK